MRYPLILLATVMVSTMACKPKVECRDYNRSMLFFESRDTIQDTAMYYGVYQRNSNFSSIVDSGLVKIGCSKTYDGKYVVAMYSSQLKNYQFDHFDWLYIFYPSGKRIKETEITFHKRKMVVNGDGSDDAICTNDLSYKANDSLYSISGRDHESSLTASDYIKY